MQSKIWKLSEVRNVIHEIIQLTEHYHSKFSVLKEALDSQIFPESEQERREEELESIFSVWANHILRMEAEVKGPWLVDFDHGNGYFCWKYGEEDILFEHPYEGGFAGRQPIDESLYMEEEEEHGGDIS